MGAGKSMILVLLFVFLFLVTGVFPLCAQNSYSEFERGLNLTEPQRMRMEEMKRRYVSEMRNLQRESLNRRALFWEMARNSEQNRERIDRLRREMEGIEVSKGSAYKGYRTEVSRSLNERQRERYNRFCDMENKRNVRRFRQKGYGD